MVYILNRGNNDFRIKIKNGGYIIIKGGADKSEPNGFGKIENIGGVITQLKDDEWKTIENSVILKRMLDKNYIKLFKFEKECNKAKENQDLNISASAQNDINTLKNPSDDNTKRKRKEMKVE